MGGNRGTQSSTPKKSSLLLHSNDLFPTVCPHTLIICCLFLFSQLIPCYSHLICCDFKPHWKTPLNNLCFKPLTAWFQRLKKKIPQPLCYLGSVIKCALGIICGEKKISNTQIVGVAQGLTLPPHTHTHSCTLSSAPKFMVDELEFPLAKTPYVYLHKLFQVFALILKKPAYMANKNEHSCNIPIEMHASLPHPWKLWSSLLCVQHTELTVNRQEAVYRTVP